MKKRILAISDIHGCYDEFNKLLEIVNYKPTKDQLILLGDYIDRGKDSKKVIKKVMDLVENGAIALRGNHDEWFLCFLANPILSASINYLSEGVGGFNTLISYLGLDYLKNEGSIENAVKRIRREYRSHIQFLFDLPYYHETNDYIFVHAGINTQRMNWRNDTGSLNWIRWEFINNPLINIDKTVVFGHTTCRTIHNSDNIWISDGKIGIDGACCFGGQLNCLEITDGEINQYHVVHEELECLNASSISFYM